MSWKKHRLGDILEYYSVRAKDIESFTDLEFCGVSNEEGITLSKYAAEDKAEEYKVIEKGCFAYNPYRINVGSIALMQEDKKGLISPAYVIFKPKPNSIIPELLLKFLKSAEGLRQIKLNARGTVRQALRFEDLCKIEITLPNYEEQIELYKNLELTQTKCNSIKTENYHQLSLLKQLRQRILQDAVQGKLIPQDPNDEPASALLERIRAEKEKLIREKKIKKEKPLPPITAEEIPFEIPENWVWCRFYSIATIESNLVNPFKFPNHPHIAPDNIEKNTGKLINYKTVKEDNVISSNHYFFPSQLIYSKVRPRLNKVIKVDFEGLCSADMYPIRPLINADYLLYCMLSSFFLAEVYKFDNRVKMPKINQNQLSQIPIPLPPINEQQRIITRIEQLMSLCDEMEQSIQQNQKFTQEFLQVALKEALEQMN